MSFSVGCSDILYIIIIIITREMPTLPPKESPIRTRLVPSNCVLHSPSQLTTKSFSNNLLLSATDLVKLKSNNLRDYFCIHSSLMTGVSLRRKPRPGGLGMSELIALSYPFKVDHISHWDRFYQTRLEICDAGQRRLLSIECNCSAFTYRNGRSC